MKRKEWTKKKWKEKRKLILSNNPMCSSCGSISNLVVHHPQKWREQTQDEYESLDGTSVLCNRCHFALHHGMNLCPVCKKKYKKIKYPACFYCNKVEIHDFEKEDMESEVWFEEFYSSPLKRQYEMLKEQDKNDA